MKEITRIHLAKISYDIEVAAKKELESYVAKLERYANDENLLEDIEIRMTEILAGRGIEKNGVITKEDVDALEAQLGGPEEFMDENDIAVGKVGSDDELLPRRRLYRDVESAILGGVLSGAAKYLRINALWTRLGFIVLLFISWGFAAVVYAILWIVLPPARSAADRLALAGKPVTLASLKALNEQDVVSAKDSNTSRVMKNILRYGTGTATAAAALISLIVTVWAGIGLAWGVRPETSFSDMILWESLNGWIAYSGFVLAGLLLAAFFTLLTYALFSRKWNKRLTIAVIAVVLSGIVSFGAGLGSLAYGHWQNSTAAEASRTTERVSLRSEFANIKNLTVDIGGTVSPWGGVSSAYVEYIVDETPRYEFSGIEGTHTPKFSVDGESVKLTIEAKEDRRSRFVQPSVRIYGPALASMNVESGSVRYYNDDRQDTLALITSSVEREAEGTLMTLAGNVEVSGSYGSITARSVYGSGVTLNDATVETLEASLDGGYISAGVVRTLSVTQSDICPSDGSMYGNQNRLAVHGVASGKLSYNTVEQDARSITNPCGEVVIGDEETYEESLELVRP